MIAVAVVEAIDARRSYAEAARQVLRAIADGSLLALPGWPLRERITIDGAAALMARAAAVARPEAFAEYRQQEGLV